MEQIDLWLAFSAGVVSFLSPCVLPLVPAYVSFISGLSFEELSSGKDRRAITKKAGIGSIFFVLGFGFVFTLLGASASAIGVLLIGYMAIVRKVAGVFIILFGLHLAGVLPIKWLYYEKRFQPGKISPGLIGSFLMGMAFAFGWTPCIGPILAGILLLAGTQETLARGVFLLMAYSLGLGIPFVATGFAVGSFMHALGRYRRFIRWGGVAAGILLVIMGLLIFSNQLMGALRFIPSTFSL